MAHVTFIRSQRRDSVAPSTVTWQSVPEFTSSWLMSTALSQNLHSMAFPDFWSRTWGPVSEEAAWRRVTPGTSIVGRKDRERITTQLRWVASTCLEVEFIWYQFSDSQEVSLPVLRSSCSVPHKDDNKMLLCATLRSRCVCHTKATIKCCCVPH